MHKEMTSTPISNRFDPMANSDGKRFKCNITVGKPKPICKVPNIPDMVAQGVEKDQ